MINFQRIVSVRVLVLGVPWHGEMLASGSAQFNRLVSEGSLFGLISEAPDRCGDA